MHGQIWRSVLLPWGEGKTGGMLRVALLRETSELGVIAHIHGCRSSRLELCPPIEFSPTHVYVPKASLLNKISLDS